MSCEHDPSCKVVNPIVRASREEDWPTVDRRVKKLHGLGDDNGVARAALSYGSDPDTNVRDGVATILASLHVTDPELADQVVERMDTQVREDEIWAAGRGCVVLLSFAHHPKCGVKAQAGITSFVERAIKEGWVEDLRRDVPELEDILP